MFWVGQWQRSGSHGQRVLRECEASEHREDSYTLQIFAMGTKAAPGGCMRQSKGNPGCSLKDKVCHVLGRPRGALPQNLPQHFGNNGLITSLQESSECWCHFSGLKVSIMSKFCSVVQLASLLFRQTSMIYEALKAKGQQLPRTPVRLVLSRLTNILSTVY